MYACLVIGLVLLAAPVAGQIPDAVTVSTDTAWLTAGSGETAAITVNVTNSTPATGVGGVRVELSVDGTDGSITPAKVVTAADGKATARFRPGTKSGTARITATVLYEGLDEPLTDSVEQHIDHAAPYRLASLWYNPEVIVGETTDIVLRMEDRYGNPVDSRRVAETVTFMVGSPAGGARFEESGSDKATVEVDETGNATATLCVDMVAGENIVYIQPPASAGSGRYITITAAGGEPAGIYLVVDPASASVPADGDKVIRLTYTLRDAFGNSAPGQGLWVNATIQRAGRPDKQSVLLHSNHYGQVMVTYGPEDSMGNATITATAAANSSVSVTKEVEFTSTEPVDIVLSASPQSMPSRDVNSSSVAQLRAKVMDVKGNPVKGETVTFEIVPGSINHDEEAKLVGNPYLGEPPGQNESTAVTDESGYATVSFHPGKFDEPSAGEKRIAARGNATVRATWGTATRSLILTWMNYPYLSVETEVSPATIGMNDTVDVTIRLTGDGYELQPDPIDVVLCTDRSGSMLFDNPDRMHSVREAAKTFVDQFAENHDRAATVSFGRNGTISRPGENSGIDTDEIDNNYTYPKTYSDYATLDIELTYDLEEVKEALDGIVPDHGTPLRQGLKISIDHLTSKAKNGSVRAVVLLSDGDYNWYGDPLARGSSGSNDPTYYWDYWDRTTKYYKFTGLSTQDLSVYAMNNNITIYSIGYADTISQGGKDTLRILAESTGGKYYDGNAANIEAIYTEIAGELKTEAGVNTTMTVLDKVEVNKAPIDAFKVFDYRHENGVSTYILNKSGDGTTLYDNTIDQTAGWNTGHNLHFDIGTIHLNQVWKAEIRLAVNSSYEAGDYNNINIFGPGASLSFNNGEDTLDLPDTFLTVLPDLNNTGITSAWLEVYLKDPELPPGQESFTDTVPLEWTITYNGTSEIHETLAYSNDNRLSWTVFWTKTVGSSATGGTALLDARSLPAGDYWIRLTASADDAPDARDTTRFAIPIGSTSRAYIKIE
jgi:Mg-chelatase subunit ChlD